MIKKGSVGVCDLPTRFCEQCMTMTDIQSSQVDLLAKSEIFDSVAIVCDTAGQTLLGGVWGHAPAGNFCHNVSDGPLYQSVVIICELVQLSLNPGSAQ